jgi:hypothetical protein
MPSTTPLAVATEWTRSTTAATDAGKITARSSLDFESLTPGLTEDFLNRLGETALDHLLSHDVERQGGPDDAVGNDK